jgi:ubiquinone/menaquinone biosynthesis C-methylase UbiE
VQATSAYGPLCTLFYDADKPRAGDDELTFYLDRLPDDSGPALEAMCGSGRLLVPLAASGRNMHGVDVSPSMLASCEARLGDAGLRATLFRQNVADLNLPFRYGAAIIAAGSFQLLTDPSAARAALERIRAHLVPPARLLLDLFVPPEGAQRLGAPLVEVRSAQLPDGTRIALRSETTMFAEARLARTASRYVRRRGSKHLGEENEATAFTWYSPDEIIALVKEAGFSDVEVGPPARAADDVTGYTVVANG